MCCDARREPVQSDDDEARVPRPDGADTALVRAVDAGSPEAMSTGMRVTPRWRADPVGMITDIEA